MARFTRTVPLAGDMLAATSRLGRFRDLSSCVGTLARKTRAPEETQLGRNDRRRHVFSRKKRGAAVGKTKKGKGTKIMLMVDGEGTPLSAFTLGANTAEVHAIENLIDDRVPKRKPDRVLYDKAADADWLRECVAARGIELICPHRVNRKKPAIQDRRSLRRYKRRYKVERSISWLFNNRRLITRWEYYPELFQGFVHLACLYTIIKRF